MLKVWKSKTEFFNTIKITNIDNEKIEIISIPCDWTVIVTIKTQSVTTQIVTTQIVTTQNETTQIETT